MMVYEGQIWEHISGGTEWEVVETGTVPGKVKLVSLDNPRPERLVTYNELYTHYEFTGKTVESM